MDKFDIAQHEWSDSYVSLGYESDSLITLDVEDCGLYHSLNLDKQDAIAIAKRLNVTAEDLK